MAPPNKPILCIDFDGVIHSYEKGWQNGAIYGTPTPGFWDWAMEAEKLFKLVVYSSRSKDKSQRHAMEAWMRHHWRIDTSLPLSTMPTFEFAAEKPAAFLTIDDRAIKFNGSWRTFDLEPAKMLAFKPWNMQKEEAAPETSPSPK